jgi:hypothetical protein
MKVAALALSLLVLAGSAQAKDVEVQLRNEAGGPVVLTTAEGKTLALDNYKEGALVTSDQARDLTMSFKGCDYAYRFPQVLDQARAVGDGPVKILIAEDLQLWWVPFELILYTPPRFLDSQQPADFPIAMPKPVCKP